MHTKELKHIISQHCAALEDAVAGIQKDFEKDAIHAFRVQVKKLRAFLRLLDLTIPGRIKKVYTAAGQIRDIQLQVKQIREASENTSVPAEYLAVLEEQLQKRMVFFESVAKKNHFAGSQKKLIEKLPSRLPFENIGQFLHQEIAAMLALIKDGLKEDNDFHRMRKKIKGIVYINEIYQEALQARCGPEILDAPAVKKTLALAKELGQFIDKWVALSLLKTGSLDKIGTAERKKLDSIQRRWAAQKQALRKRVSIKLKSADFRSALKG
jgi:CHAD domain-containing protein